MDETNATSDPRSMTEAVDAVHRAQVAAIDRVLRLVCGHFGIDPLVPAQLARVERRAHRRRDMHLDTQEIAVDDVVVWRLEWTRDEYVIRATAEWLGPLALRYAFVPAFSTVQFSKRT